MRGGTPELTERFTMRLAPDDRARVQELAARTPGATPGGLARAALRLGLLVLERQARPANGNGGEAA